MAHAQDGPNTPLTFASDSHGVVRHVDEVPNGLACGCVCPACGARLVAKQGPENIHHFAHEVGEECAVGVETALHLAAKAVLARERRMMVPGLEVVAEAWDSIGQRHRGDRSIVAQVVAFDDVDSEVRMGDRVPDIVTRVRGRTLLVEIFVTNPVDDAKRAWVRKHGISAVEIDLSGMREGWTWAALTEALTERASDRTWLYHAQEARRWDAAQLDAETAAKAANIWREQQVARRREAVAHVPGFFEALERLKVFNTPGQLAAERARMENARVAQGDRIAFKQISSVGGWFAPLDCINLAVTGAIGIPVDPSVWQAAVFNRYISHNRDISFSVTDAQRWCVRTFGWRSEFAILHQHKDLLTPEERDGLPSTVRPVNEWLAELERIGIVRIDEDRCTILAQKGRCPAASPANE